MLEKFAKEPARDAAHNAAGGELRNIEAIIVLRIMDNLGYIGESGTLQTLIKSPFEENILLEAAKNRKAILSEINKALKETHL